MLTAKDKDSILIYLLSQNNRSIYINYNDIEKETCINKEYIDMIIEQMELKGLITIRHTKDGGLLKMQAEAFDFYEHGGFQAQEILFRSQINKLGLEIDKLSKDLSPDVLKKLKNISDIASSVYSIASLLPTDE